MTKRLLGAPVLAALLAAMVSGADAQPTTNDRIVEDEKVTIAARTVAPLGMAYPVGYFAGYVEWGGLNWWCEDIQRTYVAYGDEEGVTNIDFAGYGAMPCYHEWYGWQERPGDFYYSGPWQDCLSEFGSDCPLYCNWYSYPNISGCQGSFQTARSALSSRTRGSARRNASALAGWRIQEMLGPR